jgi:hypothetical protein
MKASCLATAALIFALFSANVFANAALVRGEIKINDGPEISFGVPVGLLQALKTSGISAMVEDKEELGRLIDALMADLESMKDSHLLVLKAKNDVEAHIWVEEADPDDPMQANFVFVEVACANHEAEVSLRIPQAVFLLGSFMGNQFMEVHGEEIIKMIHQSFLAKIKERKHEHSLGHEQPHHDQPHHEQPHHEQPQQGQLHHEQPHHNQPQHGQPQHEQPHHGQPRIEEMHQHMGHLKEKIDHLRRQGRHEEAKGLEREADDIRRKIEEMEREHGHKQPHHEQASVEEMHQHMGHLKEKIDQLHRQGRHDDAKGLEREVDDIRRKIEEMERAHGHEQPHHEEPHQGRSGNSEQRTRALNEAANRMFEAAKRLHEANMHELAEELAREAERLRREINR